MSLDPNDVNSMSDQEATEAIRRLLGKSNGPTPPSPEDEWVPIVDDRTGQVIGQRDPKTGRQVMYRQLPTPSLTETRYAEAKAQAGKLIGPPGSSVPTHYIDQAGNRITLDKNEQIASRPAYIQQLLQDVNVRLQSPELSNQEHDELIGDRDRLQRALTAAQATPSPLGGGGGTGRTVFPWEQAKDEAQTDLIRAQTTKLRREVQPEMGLMIQDYIHSVQTVKALVEKGEMSLPEADAYMQLFRQSMDAGLKGTTPFNLQKQRQEEERSRAQIGRDVVNQRLASSTSLANNLISAFSNNLDILGWGLKEGQTLRFDPLALARGFTEDASGGKEMGDLAKSLMMQLAPQQGTVPQLATQPNTGGLPASIKAGLDILMNAAPQGGQQPTSQPATGQLPTPADTTGMPLSLIAAWQLARQADDMARQQSQAGTAGQ